MDVSVGEAVKLRRRTTSTKAQILREAEEEAKRWKQKLDKRKRKKVKRSVGQTGAGTSSGDGRPGEVSLTACAINAQAAGHFRPEEFSLPNSFTSLKKGVTSRSEQGEQSSLLGASQLIDLFDDDPVPDRSAKDGDSNIEFKKKRLELESGNHLLYSKIGESQIFCSIKASDLTLWRKDGDIAVNILQTELDRIVVSPVMICTDQTLTVLDVFVEKKKVKLFTVALIGYGAGPAVISSDTLDLITESDLIHDLNFMKVMGEDKVVIFYNVHGHSRGHLLTPRFDSAEMKFLGNLQSKVRKLSSLHRSNNMFLCFCDSSLIIWDLKTGTYISKPMCLPPCPPLISGVMLVRNILIFVRFDWETAMLKLSVFEHENFKDLSSYKIGFHSLKNMSLVSAEKKVLTFIAGSEVFHLNLNTSKIDSEFVDNFAVIGH